MKVFLLVILVVSIFLLGWYSIARQPKQDAGSNIDIGQFFLSGASSSSGLSDPKVRAGEFEKFGNFLSKIEKKYQTGASFPSMNSYVSYLEEAIKYTYQNPVIYSSMRYPFVDMNENINYVREKLLSESHSNYGPISQIIVSIHSSFPNRKIYPQVGCVKYLMEEQDLGKYLSDLSLLSYTKYSNARLFNMALSENKLSDLYNKDGLESKAENELPISIRLSRLVISDILFFQSVKSMTLEGISDAIVCSSENQNEREACTNLKKALKEGDKEFIRNKFQNNSRKYDLDSLFILYLIGDLDKQAFVDKVCLVK